MNPLIPFGKNRYSGPWCHNPWIFWTVEGPRNSQGPTAYETFEECAPVSMVRMPPAAAISARIQQQCVLKREQREALATWEDEGGGASTVSRVNEATAGGAQRADRRIQPPPLHASNR